NLNLNRQELSRIARLGSGSATRSIFGGFVEWQKGYDDQTSFAFPINEHPQMDLTMLAVELDVSQKDISSTCGMKIAQTSPIKNNNFTRLGELSELSANEMHSLNLTAMQSFSYFQPTTITIMNLVRNLRKNGIECYYTIDAGPNVKILCQDKNVEDICKAIHNTLDSVKIIKSKFGPGVQIINCDD
ncbi:MAG: diphosphomevalonate decarboxylase, partial [Lactobacillus iners]|nr:diphosphomevalonate decarboxylase [Lactobacillus iners]